MIVHKKIVTILSEMLIAYFENIPSFTATENIKDEYGRFLREEPITHIKPIVRNMVFRNVAYWEWVCMYLKRQEDNQQNLEYSLYTRKDDFYELVKEFRKTQSTYLELSTLPHRKVASLPNYIYSGWYKAALKDQIEEMPTFSLDSSEAEGIANYKMFISCLPKLKAKEYRITDGELAQYLEEVERLTSTTNTKPAGKSGPDYYVCYFWNEKMRIGHITLDNKTVTVEIIKKGLDSLKLTGEFSEHIFGGKDTSKLIQIDIRDNKEAFRKTNIIIYTDSQEQMRYLIGTFNTTHRGKGMPYAGLILLEYFNYIETRDKAIKDGLDDKSKIPDIYHHLLYNQYIGYPTSEFKIKNTKSLPNYANHEAVKGYSGSYKAYILDPDEQQINVVYIHINSAGLCVQLGNDNLKSYGIFNKLPDGPLVGTINYKGKHNIQVVLKREKDNQDILKGVFSSVSDNKKPLAGRIALVRELEAMEQLDIWADGYTNDLIKHKGKFNPLTYDQIISNPKFDDLVEFFGKDNKDIYTYLVVDSNLFSTIIQTLPVVVPTLISAALVGNYYIYCLSSTDNQINKMPIQVLSDATITVKVKIKEKQPYICTGVIEEDLPCLIARTTSSYLEGKKSTNPHKYTQQFVFHHGALKDEGLGDRFEFLWGTFSFMHTNGFPVAGKCLLVKAGESEKFIDMEYESIATNDERVKNSPELKKLLADKLIKVSKDG